MVSGKMRLPKIDKIQLPINHTKAPKEGSGGMKDYKKLAR